MAVRIYSLARDLKIDSKEILEFCKKAGIEGKGSALASLTEEECALLQAAMKKSAAPSEAPEPIKPELAPPDGPDPVQPMQRTDYVPASGVVAAVAGDSSEVKTEEQEKKLVKISISFIYFRKRIIVFNCCIIQPSFNSFNYCIA